MQPIAEKISTEEFGFRYRGTNMSYTVANDFIMMYGEVGMFLTYDLGTRISNKLLEQESTTSNIPDLTREVYRNIQEIDDRLSVSVILKQLKEESTIEDVSGIIRQFNNVASGSQEWLLIIRAIALMSVLYVTVWTILLIMEVVLYLFILRKEYVSQIRYLL